MSSENRQSLTNTIGTVGSENVMVTVVEDSETGSENMAAGRRGRRPTPLPPPSARVLTGYAAQVGRGDVTAPARRTRLLRGRMFLAWTPPRTSTATR